MLFHKKGGYCSNRIRTCKMGMAYLPAKYSFFVCDRVFNCPSCYMNGDIPECRAYESSKFHWTDVRGHGVLGLFLEEEI